MNRALFLWIVIFFQPGPVGRATKSAQTPAAAEPVSASADGFQSQFNSTLEAYQVGGKANGRRALDLFQLPRSEEWLTGRLGPDPSGKFAERYNRIYVSFADSLEKTIDDVQKTRGAKLLTGVEPGKEQMPSFAIRGRQPSGIHAIKAPPLFYCHFTIQINGKDQVSWADEFTYDSGAFRFIGFGEQPFWAWQEGSEGAAPKAGSFVQPAVLISRVLPAYPAGARGKQDLVILHYVIDKNGKVKNPRVVSGDAAFTNAAINAVRQWRYRPATMGGMPIESEATATVQFHP